MMIQPISEAVIPQCLALEVSFEQRKQNKSPAEIFADAYLHQDVLRAFVLEGTKPVVVGMASYFNNTYRGYGYWIGQFFIDQRYQRQGHGTKAFGILLTEMKALADHRIIVSVDKENLTAIRLY
jgi:RimJ/RimL family protein N-acetyltransferase